MTWTNCWNSEYHINLTNIPLANVPLAGGGQKQTEAESDNVALFKEQMVHYKE